MDVAAHRRAPGLCLLQGLDLEDRGRSLRPQSRREGLSDDAGGLAAHVHRGGDSEVDGSLDLPGEGGPHVLLAGEGPGQLPGGARKVSGSVLLLLKISERGSLAVILAVLVEGAVPLGVGVVPGGLADGALVPPQHGAGHQTAGILHGVAHELNLRLAIGKAELAVTDFHVKNFFEDAVSTEKLFLRWADGFLKSRC